MSNTGRWTFEWTGSDEGENDPNDFSRETTPNARRAARSARERTASRNGQRTPGNGYTNGHTNGTGSRSTRRYGRESDDDIDDYGGYTPLASRRTTNSRATAGHYDSPPRTNGRTNGDYTSSRQSRWGLAARDQDSDEDRGGYRANRGDNDLYSSSSRPWRNTTALRRSSSPNAMPRRRPSRTNGYFGGSDEEEDYGSTSRTSRRTSYDRPDYPYLGASRRYR